MIKNTTRTLLLGAVLAASAVSQGQPVDGFTKVRQVLQAKGITEGPVPHSGYCLEIDAPTRKLKVSNTRSTTYQRLKTTVNPAEGAISVGALPAPVLVPTKFPTEYSAVMLLSQGGCHDPDHHPNCCNYESIRMPRITVARGWTRTNNYSTFVLNGKLVKKLAEKAHPAVGKVPVGEWSRRVYMGQTIKGEPWGESQYSESLIGACYCGGLPTRRITPWPYIDDDIIIENEPPDGALLLGGGQINDARFIPGNLGVTPVFQDCTASNDWKRGTQNCQVTTKYTFSTITLNICTGFSPACNLIYEDVDYHYVSEIEVTHAFMGGVYCQEKPASGPGPHGHDHIDCAPGCDLEQFIGWRRHTITLTPQVVPIHEDRKCPLFLPGVPPPAEQNVITGWTCTLQASYGLPDEAAPGDACACEEEPQEPGGEVPVDGGDGIVIDEGDDAATTGGG